MYSGSLFFREDAHALVWFSRSTSDFSSGSRIAAYHRFNYALRVGVFFKEFVKAQPYDL